MGLSTEEFGTDIGYQYDGVSADAHHSGADIGIADGLNNLYQAIQNRILTPMGSIPLHPNYGSRLYTLIGKGNTPLIETFVKMMIVEALQDESRIKLIENIDVKFSRTTQTLYVTVEIMSIYSTELTVNTTVGG